MDTNTAHPPTAGPLDRLVDELVATGAQFHQVIAHMRRLAARNGTPDPDVESVLRSLLRAELAPIAFGRPPRELVVAAEVLAAATALMREELLLVAPGPAPSGRPDRRRRR